MAEGFALGIAQKGLEQLSSLAFREIVLALGAERELQELRLTITTIRTTLLHAERRQEKSDEEMLWLERFKSVCYAADDIVDEFEIIALKQRQQQVLVSSSSSSMQRMRFRFKSKVHHFFSSSNPLIFHFKIGHHIKNVQQRVARIAKEKALSERQEMARAFIQSHPPAAPDICMTDKDSDSIMMNFIKDDHSEDLKDNHGEDRENIMLNFLMELLV